MMEDEYKLENADPDDIGDIMLIIERSFRIKFDQSELEALKTFGGLCDIILSKIEGDLKVDCTTQQAFYKIRNAIAVTSFPEKVTIKPDTNLRQIFPQGKRRYAIKQIEKELGFRLNIFEPAGLAAIILLLLSVSSLVMLFFNWRIGLPGMALSWALIAFVNKYGRTFSVKTVGELAEKVSREYYFNSRSDVTTMNKEEIIQKVRELFVYGLGIEEEPLTRDASFN